MSFTYIFIDILSTYTYVLKIVIDAYHCYFLKWRDFYYTHTNLS